MWGLLLLPFATGERSFLSIAIISNAPHFEQRQGIRDSWLQERTCLAVPTRIAFFVGMSPDDDDEVNRRVREEAKRHGDLQVMDNLVESYRGIVRKTRRAVEWGFSGPGTDFLFKTDDDSYVVLGELVRTLTVLKETNPEWRQVLFGEIFRNKSPVREPEHRWYVSKEDWAAEKFPDYATGSGYVLGCGLGEFLMRKEVKIREKMVPVEDVTVGIWLHRLHNEYNQTVIYKHDDRIQHSRILSCLPSDIIGNPYTPDEMRRAWQSGSICI